MRPISCGKGIATDAGLKILLLIEDKLIICALGNLHYQISREKFEPEPGFEPRTSGFLASALPLELSRIAQVVEHRARNPELRIFLLRSDND